jgi:hypothetical protein
VTVTVQDAVVKVSQVPSAVRLMNVPDEQHAYWAECSDCKKRSRAFLVGWVSAPAREAQTQADAHRCDIEGGYFSTVDAEWAEFTEMVTKAYELAMDALDSGGNS